MTEGNRSGVSSPHRSATIKVLGTNINMKLIRHDMTDLPQTRADHVAYVQPDASDRLVMAFWKRGAWVDYRSRPFAGTPVAWYSLEPTRG